MKKFMLMFGLVALVVCMGQHFINAQDVEPGPQTETEIGEEFDEGVPPALDEEEAFFCPDCHASETHCRKEAKMMKGSKRMKMKKAMCMYMPNISVSVSCADLTPIDNFVQVYVPGASSYGDNTILYGITWKVPIMRLGGLLVGFDMSTTMDGIDILDPKLFTMERIKYGTDTSNQGQFYMMTLKAFTGYKFMLGDCMYVDAGLGFGLHGAKVAVMGQNSGSFRLPSFLLAPELTLGFGPLSATLGYNYCTNKKWEREYGTLGYPADFDMSALYASINISLALPLMCMF